ncbi:allantoinase PuuE [Dactylosporangium sp. NPDC048998]|uniref:allantoinase PuuE n=1 Tax=Dactylosporangium sp. NPDC048998 TaxID=3363976 RepID=UPI003712AEB4
MVDVPGPRRDLVGYARDLPPGGWPGDARIAISVVVNYEEGSERSFAMGDPDQETSTEWNSYALPPGVRNLAMETMYEYGSRVGIWRILDVLDKYRVKATFFACAVAIEQNPHVGRAIVEGGHSVVSHGYRWEETFRLSRDQEREHIRLATASFTRTLGIQPRGWYCRYGPSINTRELLVEEGFDYDCDAYNDDLPYFVEVRGKRHLVVPYTPDVNDFRFWQSPGIATSSQFFEYLKDSFDVLYAEGARRPRMMSIGLHPRQIGRPGRIAGLERFLAYTQDFDGVAYLTRDQIADAWLADHGGTGGS